VEQIYYKCHAFATADEMLHGFLPVQHGLNSLCSNGYRTNVALLKLHKSVTFQIGKTREILLNKGLLADYYQYSENSK